MKWVELGLDSSNIPGLWVIYMAQILSLLILGFKMARPSWEDLQVSLCGAVPLGTPYSLCKSQANNFQLSGMQKCALLCKQWLVQ